MAKNNNLSEKEVKHIAKLANLPLSGTEIKKFESQLSETLNYIDTLSQIKTTDTKPTNQVTGLQNVTRNDEPSPSLTQEQALKNAKETHNGFIKVKAIFDEQS